MNTDNLLHLLAQSAATLDGPVHSMVGLESWLEQQRAAMALGVEVVPLETLDQWSFSGPGNDLRHASGRFFSVSAVRWQDATIPFFIQPEVGILGILAARIEGVMHFLLQAKVEPGNICGVQISPSVQATRSNYSRAHGGAAPPYLLEIAGEGWPGRSATIVVDQFQSEQGRRYLRKRNRNTVMLLPNPVDPLPGFTWFTVGQLLQLTHQPDLVNSCLRSIVATIPGPGGEGFWRDQELVSMFRYFKEQAPDPAQVVGLENYNGWRSEAGRLVPRLPTGPGLMGVRVSAGSREVRSWTQPLLFEPQLGEYGAIITTVHGEPHWVVRFAFEPGLYDLVEWGPTWIIRDGTEGSDPARWNDATLGRTVFDNVFSEEGGRFYHSRFRHVVRHIPYNRLPALPDDCVLVGHGQLKRFANHAHYLSIELRSLLSCAREEWWAAGESR